MKISNLEIVESPYSIKHLVRVDVTTGYFRWKKTERVLVQCDYNNEWRFVGTGKPAPENTLDWLLDERMILDMLDASSLSKKIDKKVDTKYPEYIEGEPIPSSMRICNVVICRDTREEFLLGSDQYKGRSLLMRNNPTLIPKGRIENE